MPCSRAIISGYAAWFCVGVSSGGVPCYYGPGLDGNDPLLLHCLYFIFVLHGFGVALEDDCSFMGGG